MTPAAQQLLARIRAERSIGLASRRRRVPRARFPLLIESDYAGRLVAIVQRMRAMTSQALPGLLAELPGGTLRADESPVARARGRSRRLRTEIEASIDDGGIGRTAESVGRRVAEHHRGELARQGRAGLGVEVMVLDPSIPGVIEGFVHENVSLISKLRGKALDELEAIVVRAYSDGARAETIAPQIAARYDIAERHARLIARDQIGKLNSRVTAARHQELGIAMFEWGSMKDPKVRPRHRELDGKRFRYDKPPAEGLPGQPVACRCVQQPVFDELLGLADQAPAIAAAAPLAPAASAAKPARPPRATRTPRPPTVQPLQPGGAAVANDLRAGRLDLAQGRLEDALEGRGFPRAASEPGLPARRAAVAVSDEGLRVRDLAGNEQDARAVRHWNGEIQISTRIAADLRSFGGLSDGGSVADRMGALEGNIARLAQRRRAASPERRKKLPTTDAMRAELSELRRASDGARSLVHETCHGFTPVSMRAYQGVGARIEEITTERVARLVGRDVLGLTDRGITDGSYGEEILVAVNAISEAARIDRGAAYGALGRAAERFKRRAVKLHTPANVLEAFAEDCAAEVSGQVPAMRAALEKHLALPRPGAAEMALIATREKTL